jgi:hypothetical protein
MLLFILGDFFILLDEDLHAQRRALCGFDVAFEDCFAVLNILLDFIVIIYHKLQNLFQQFVSIL